MNSRYLSAACLLLVSVAANATGAPPPERHELPVGDCMRTDRITNYTVVDLRTVTVANGPNFFKITTDVDCPRMDLGGGVRFKTAENIKAVQPMAICGSINEKIIRQGSGDPPCTIQSVEKIDKATYEQLNQKHRTSGPGTSGGAH